MGRYEAITHRVIQMTSSSVNSADLLDSVTALMCEGLELAACLVYLWNPEQQLLIPRGTSRGEDAIEEPPLQLDEGPAGSAAGSRTKIVFTAGATSGPQGLCIPLISRTGSLLGVLEARSNGQGDLAEEDVRLLETTCTLLSGGIEASQLLLVSGQRGEALAALMRKMIQVQEEERRRVATEIHDGVTQQLVSIWFRVHACQRLLEREALEEARGEIVATKELIDETLVDARAAIYNLRPATLDDLGLVPALNELSTRFTAECGVPVGIDAPEEMHLSPHLETAMYRITQEALANVRKHAQARSVMLTLRSTEDGAELRVVDDGQGFDVEGFLRSRSNTSFGLAGMRERIGSVGGRFQFHSAIGEGTTLQVTVPIHDEAMGMVP